MGFLSKLFTGGVGSTVDKIAGVADRFINTPQEKQAFKAKIAELLRSDRAQAEETARAEIDARARVLVAELQQDDRYTKRARPTIVYAGVAMTLIEAIPRLVVALNGGEVPTTPIVPLEFWATWGGVTSIYVIGRSAEKRGSSLGEKLREVASTKPKKLDPAAIFED